MSMAHYFVSSSLMLVSLTSAEAATPPAKMIENVTCREFVAMEDSFKPYAISYALGYEHGKKPGSELIEFTGISKLVPVVVSSCLARPAESLLQRVEADVLRL